MKLIFKILFFFTLILSTQNACFSQVNFRFKLELEEIPSGQSPDLQSYVYGITSAGKWLLLGGRSNGLHRFNVGDGTAFPPLYANPLISVYDPVNDSIWNLFPDQYLPISITDQLRATGHQFVQKENKLYIMGGYGVDNSSIYSDEFVTFPQLIIIDVDEMAEAVMQHVDPGQYIRSIEDDFVRVTGGSLLYYNSHFYLVCGQNFEGVYSVKQDPENDPYTEAIRIMDIVDNEQGIFILNKDSIVNEELLHRRDLNVVEEFSSDGEEIITIYSGVFTENRSSWPHPVYITGKELFLDDSYSQLFNVYDCPRLPIYDVEHNEMTTVLFGGITLASYVDGKAIIDSCEFGSFKAPCLPFDNLVLAIQHDEYGAISDSVFMRFIDTTLLGTNAEFILSPFAPQFSNSCIDLNAIDSKVHIGYIYGGIDATLKPYGYTMASNRIFKVYIKPDHNQGLSDYQKLMIEQPFPNPANTSLTFQLPKTSFEHEFCIRIYNAQGFLLKEVFIHPTERNCQINTSKFPSGIYVYEVAQNNRSGKGKFAIVH